MPCAKKLVLFSALISLQISMSQYSFARTMVTHSDEVQPFIESEKSKFLTKTIIAGASFLTGVSAWMLVTSYLTKKAGEVPKGGNQPSVPAELKTEINLKLVPIAVGNSLTMAIVPDMAFSEINHHYFERLDLSELNGNAQSGSFARDLLQKFFKTMENAQKYYEVEFLSKGYRWKIENSDNNLHQSFLIVRSYYETLKDLQNAIEINPKLRGQKKKIQKLETEKRDIKNELADKRGEIRKNNKLISQLVDRVKSFEDEIHSLYHHVEELDLELEIKNQDLETARQQIKSLKGDIQEKETLIEEFKKVIGSLAN